MAPKNVAIAQISENAQEHEDQYVHAIYDQIASHFSATRYKPWPIIAKFLDSLPTGYVGLDSGTGNGKYLPLPLDRPYGRVWTIGLDRSRNLLEIARTAGTGDATREVVWGDVIGKGWRDGAFDYAISIATVHHLATPDRRKLAIKRLLQSVSPSHGRILIYVWAIEQDELSKRNVPSELKANDTPDPKAGRDVFVPWVLSAPKPQPKGHRSPKAGLSEDTHQDQEIVATSQPQVFNRYYHMFAKGELTELVHEAAKDLGLHVGPSTEEKIGGSGVVIVQDGWERSNYFVELRCWAN